MRLLLHQARPHCIRLDPVLPAQKVEGPAWWEGWQIQGSPPPSILNPICRLSILTGPMKTCGLPIRSPMIPGKDLFLFASIMDPCGVKSRKMTPTGGRPQQARLPIGSVQSLDDFFRLQLVLSASVPSWFLLVSLESHSGPRPCALESRVSPVPPLILTLAPSPAVVPPPLPKPCFKPTKP